MYWGRKSRTKKQERGEKMKSLIPYDEYGVFVDNKIIDELVHQAILNSSKNLDGFVSGAII